MCRLVLSAIILLSLSSSALAQSVFVVRHAERADSGTAGAGMMATDPELSADRQLWHGLVALLDAVAADPDRWRLVSRRALQEGAKFGGAPRALRRTMVAVVGRQLKRAAAQGPKEVKDDDIHGLAVALVGACEAMADHVVDNPQAESRVAASQLMNLTWMGFGRLLEGKRWRP